MRRGSGHRADPVGLRLGTAQLIKIGARRYDWRDPYNFAVTIGWPAFFATILATDLALNLAFALLYALQPGAIANARPGSLVDAFFFSAETLATVGYGVMAPATLYGHIVSSFEILCGLTFTALVTGLIFVRFSKARAGIRFADVAVIAQHNRRPTLMLRLANTRSSLLTGATARLHVLLAMESAEGRTFRHFLECTLARDYMPMFVLSWTLMHEIDAASPLYGMTAEDVAAADARLVLTVEARDNSIGAAVTAIQVYGPEKLLFGMTFQDAVTRDSAGRTRADFRRLDLVEPDRPVTDGDFG
jgi:inward rectifier potassium channel